MFTKQALAVGLDTLYAPGSAMGGVDARLDTIVNPLIANTLIISGVVAFFTVFLAGYNYISAGGDKAKTEQAQNMLTYGILGLIVIASAYLITRLIGAQFGLKLF